MKCLMIHDEPVHCVMSEPIINGVIHISARQLEKGPVCGADGGPVSATAGNAAALLPSNDGDSAASPLRKTDPR